MTKKIFGILFFIVALLIIIGAIANGSLFSDQGSAAATYGNFVGTMLPVVLYVLSGIFLLTFDNPTKMNYIYGFKKRSKQSSIIIVFFIVSLLLYSIQTFGLGVVTSAKTGISDLGPIAFMLVNVIFNPFLLPFIVFTVFLLIYVPPHNASKKYFVKNDASLNEYLSTNETFYTYSNDNFVLASSKVLYFPKLFCVIPFNQISSIEFYKQLWEQGIYIHISNGKKIYIATKHYDRIQEAINAYKQSQQ